MQNVRKPVLRNICFIQHLAMAAKDVKQTATAFLAPSMSGDFIAPTPLLVLSV